MYCFVSCILCCWVRYAIIVHEGVAFHKTHEMALTWSKWLSALVTDTQPPNNLLKRLSEDMRKAEIAANSREQFYDYPSKQDYH